MVTLVAPLCEAMMDIGISTRMHAPPCTPPSKKSQKTTRDLFKAPIPPSTSQLALLPLKQAEEQRRKLYGGAPCLHHLWKKSCDSHRGIFGFGTRPRTTRDLKDDTGDGLQYHGHSFSADFPKFKANEPMMIFSLLIVALPRALPSVHPSGSALPPVSPHPQAHHDERKQFHIGCAVCG